VLLERLLVFLLLEFQLQLLLGVKSLLGGVHLGELLCELSFHASGGELGLLLEESELGSGSFGLHGSDVSLMGSLLLSGLGLGSSLEGEFFLFLLGNVHSFLLSHVSEVSLLLGSELGSHSLLLGNLSVHLLGDGLVRVVLGGLHSQSSHHLGLHRVSDGLGHLKSFGSHVDESRSLLVVLLLLLDLSLLGRLALGELDLLFLFLDLEFSLNSGSGDLDSLFSIFDGNSLSSLDLSELLLLEFLLEGTFGLVLTDGNHLGGVSNFSSSVGFLLEFLLDARAVDFKGELGLGSSLAGFNFGGSGVSDGFVDLLISMFDSFDSLLVVNDNDLFVGNSSVSTVGDGLDSGVLNSLLQVSNLLFSFLGISLGFGSSLCSSEFGEVSYDLGLLGLSHAPSFFGSL